MKSILSYLLAFLLLFPCVALGEGSSAQGDILIEEVSAVRAELVSRPLPIDFSGGFAPLADGYDGDYSYQDPTIQVNITYNETKDYIEGYRGRNMGYWVVDIKIGDASQLRTAAAESFSTETTLPVSDIANRVNAVVAINGDYFARHKEGFAIRQGTLVRDKLKGNRDALLIDEDGDFHVYHLPEKGSLSDTVDGKKVVNAFYFGPILVENGEVPKKLPNFTFLKPDKYYARLALCQVDRLHYKIILTTMEQDYTLGIRLKDFAKLCQAEGAKIAYNLDGGLSTTLFFNNKRINEQKKVNFRSIPDIVYFASAWNGEE
ncbi:MAG: phosphodiester glycosidase family protein [Clostridia bacterium]|nr:phosphodiester glycosidase family protein [Clostridia bacterium]